MAASSGESVGWVGFLLAVAVFGATEGEIRGPIMRVMDVRQQLPQYQSAIAIRV